MEIGAAAKRLVEDAEYLSSLRQRLIAGRSPHMEALLFQYAYGRPGNPPDCRARRDVVMRA